MTKYGNTPVDVDGRPFASKAEARRYRELRLLEDAGQIHHLRCQTEFVLIDSFTDGEGHKHRQTAYICDFCYTEDGALVVEDVKGAPETEVFRIKRKLLLSRYPAIKFRVTR